MERTCNCERMKAALDLLAFKARCSIAKSPEHDIHNVSLDIEDVNDVLTTAGLAIVVRRDVEEVEVI